MKKTHVTTRTMLFVLCAVVLFAAMALALLLPTAQAYTSGNVPSSGDKYISEIYDQSTGTFNKDQLQKLINLLANNSGSSNASVNEISESLQGNNIMFGDTTTGTKTNTTYHNAKRIASDNIIVEFGGIKWIAVFMSLPKQDNGTVDNGDVILTLWQAVGDQYSQWNTWSDNNAGSQTYPSNLYSTSYMRAVTLNNGGKYATNKTTLGGNATQNESNRYALFTMSQLNGASNTAYDCIVAPRYMEWQEIQNANNVVMSTNARWVNGYLNNESWGNTTGGTYHNASYRYDGFAYYGDWADDRVWLPSSSEVGFTGATAAGDAGVSNGTTYKGLWETNGTQRSNTNSGSGGTANYTKCAWLRTANGNNYSNSNYLTSDGSFSGATADSSLLVRPALHLNLTSAAGAAALDKPTATDKTVVYNGENQTLSLGVATELVTKNKVTITTDYKNSAGATTNTDVTLGDNGTGTQVLTAKQAGTYKVTVTPAPGYYWKNDLDDENDNGGITFTLEIKQRKVGLDVSIPSNQDSTLVYGTPFNLTSPSDYFKYKSGTIELDSESGTSYSDSNFYQILDRDKSQLTVATPASNASAFVAPGKYPLYLELGSLESSSNYILTLSGNFQDGGGGDYAKYNGKAATITVEKRKVIIDVVVPQGQSMTFSYGETFDLQDVSHYWSYASNSPSQLLTADEEKLTITTDATKANVTPGSYKLTLAFTGDLGNYDLTINNNDQLITVTNATINLDGVNFTPDAETYSLNGPNSAVRHKLEILTGYTSVNNQQVTLSYSNFKASFVGAKENDDFEILGGIYLVWKAGTYTIDVTFEAPHHDSVTRTLTLVINKAKAIVKLVYEKPTGEIKTSGVLPALSSTATVGGYEVEGSIAWTTSLGSISVGGQYTPINWQWVPADSQNMDVVEDVEYFNISVVSVRSMEVEFDPQGQVFYDTDDLNELKNYLKVTITFDDDTVKVLGMDEYDLECQGGTVLVSGTNVSVTVKYLSKGKYITKSFRLDVLNALQEKKSEALNDLDAWYEEQKGKIEGDETLTAEQKQQQLAELEQRYEAGQDAINDATTIPEVETALRNAKKNPSKPTPEPDPTPDPDPDPNPNPNPNPNPGTEEPKKKISEWFDDIPLPLGYAAIVLGSELLLIIILAIAARKPKKQ